MPEAVLADDPTARRLAPIVDRSHTIDGGDICPTTLPGCRAPAIGAPNVIRIP